MSGSFVTRFGFLIGGWCLILSHAGQMLPARTAAWEVTAEGERFRTGKMPLTNPHPAAPRPMPERRPATRPDRFVKADTLFKRGLKDGNFLPAIEAYKAALRDGAAPALATIAHERIAKGYQKMGHHHEAVAHWQESLQLNPSSSRERGIRYNLAECLFHVQRFRESLRLFRALSDELPILRKRAWSTFRCGDCLIGLGFQNKARKYYLKAQSSRPDPRWIPPESLRNMAVSAMERNHPEKASWPLMTALSLFPDHPERPRWLYLLGESYLRQSNPAEAAFVFDRLKREHGDQMEARMAQVRLATVEVYNQGIPIVLSLAPDPETWSDSGDILFHEDTRDPLIQRAVLSLGMSLYERGNPDLAFQVLLNGIRGFDETTITSLIRENLIQVAQGAIREDIDHGRHIEVIEKFEDLSQWSPSAGEDPQILLDVAESYEEMGFQQMAVSLYEKIDRQYWVQREDREATLALIRVALALGETEKALSLVDDVSPAVGWQRITKRLLEWLARQPHAEAEEIIRRWLRDVQKGKLTPGPVVSIGRWHMEREAYQEIVAFLKETLAEVAMSRTEDAYWAEAYCLLGDALAHLGRPGEAMTYYEKVLERETWGLLEKWAAYRELCAGMKVGEAQRIEPHLERLLQEPEGGLWRTLAEYLDHRVERLKRREEPEWS